MLRQAGDTLLAVHAVRLLATARNDLTSSVHADLVAAKVERGELVVSVPDYALCVHTRAGQERGRGLTQWWETGALVNDELETADHSYPKRTPNITIGTPPSMVTKYSAAEL